MSIESFAARHGSNVAFAVTTHTPIKMKDLKSSSDPLLLEHRRLEALSENDVYDLVTCSMLSGMLTIKIVSRQARPFLPTMRWVDSKKVKVYDRRSISIVLKSPLVAIRLMFGLMSLPMCYIPFIVTIMILEHFFGEVFL